MGIFFIGKEVSGALGLVWGLPGWQSMPLLPLAVAWTKAACVDTTVAKQCLGREALSLWAPLRATERTLCPHGGRGRGGRRLSFPGFSLLPFSIENMF